MRKRVIASMPAAKNNNGRNGAQMLLYREDISELRRIYVSSSLL